MEGTSTMSLSGWCDRKRQKINKHELTILTGLAGRLSIGRDELAAAVPEHYPAEERIARILSRLGKKRAAEYVRQKLPKGKSIRSGDLGEIIGSEYIEEETDYEVAVNRLRWKYHREMAMRGDDVIGIKLEAPSKPHFLKGKIKSRATLSGPVIVEARKALRKRPPFPPCLGFHCRPPP
jgi:Cap4 SAVED domain